MKHNLIIAHLQTAFIYSKLSKANRLKVGCIIVKDNRIISIGYNGTPSGFDNNCEDDNNITKPEVLHAETNAITKLARSNESGEGASLFCTHQPCLDCSKLIYQSGIKEVYYNEKYRNELGTDFLRKAGVKIKQIENIYDNF
jgi:dCMP deaminase